MIRNIKTRFAPKTKQLVAVAEADKRDQSMNLYCHDLNFPPFLWDASIASWRWWQWSFRWLFLIELPREVRVGWSEKVGWVVASGGWRWWDGTSKGETVSCFFLQVDFSFIFEKVFISTSVSGWEGCAALQIEPFGWRWSSSLSWSRWEMKIQFEFWCHYSYNRGVGYEE